MKVYASSLIVRLVGRPARPGMDSATARLCMGYTVATAILHGQVGIQDFDPDALADPRRLELAARIEVLDDGNPDPNAMCPQRVELHLRDGRCLALDMPEFPAARRCRWTKPRKTPSSAPAAPRPNLPCRRTGPRR